MYGQTGAFLACLSVADEWGAESAQKCVTINVLPPAPPTPPAASPGSTGGTTGPGPAPPGLVALAGQDQAGKPGQPISLHGSSTGAGAPTFQWLQTAGPTVVLSGKDTASPTFQAPPAGASPVRLYFELTVRDGSRTALDGVMVTITSANAPPIARTVPAASFQPGDVVSLDAAASTDADGDALTFTWMQWDGPPVTITDALSPVASFRMPEGAATLQFAVTVSDGLETSMAMQTVTSEPLPAVVPGFTLQVSESGLVRVTPFDLGAASEWDFGDGSEPVVSTGAATHQYLASGSYDVTLVSQDGTPVAAPPQPAVVHLPADRTRPSGQDAAGSPAALWWGVGGVTLACMVGLALLLRARRRAASPRER